MELNSIYLIRLNCGPHYLVLVQKYSYHTHGSAIISSYGITNPVYIRISNGTWTQEQLVINSDLWARFNPIRINGENGDTFSKVLKNKYNNSVVFVAFAGGVSDNPFSFDSGYAIVFNSGLLVFGNYFTLIGITHNASKAIETRFIDLTK